MSTILSTYTRCTSATSNWPASPSGARSGPCATRWRPRCAPGGPREAENWERNGSASSSDIIAAAITRTVAAEEDRAYADLSNLVKQLSDALDRAAAVLDVNNLPGEAQLAAALKEMPRVDVGTVPVEIPRPFVFRFGPAFARAVVERRVRNETGPLVAEACRSYGRLLEGWIRKAVAEIQARFDAHADGYRAQLERLLAASGTTPETQAAIARDLAELKESGAVEVR